MTVQTASNRKLNCTMIEVVVVWVLLDVVNVVVVLRILLLPAVLRPNARGTHYGAIGRSAGQQ